MRLFELEDNDLDFENKWAIVEQKCSQVVADFKKYKAYLIRYTGRHVPFFYEHTPIDRKPKDTPELLQSYVDGILKEFGLIAIRSNSLFVWPSTSESPFDHMIFPENGFDFTWSPKVIDLFTSLLEPKNDEWRDNWSTPNSPGPQTEAVTHEIRKLIESAGYTDKNFGIALRNQGEIMIANCQYYAFGPMYHSRALSKLGLYDLYR